MRAEVHLVKLVDAGILRIDAQGRIWRTAVFTRKRRLKTLARPRRCDKKNGRGYRTVHGLVDGKDRCAQAHRLVWLCGNGAIPEGLDVIHKDGRRDNNRPSNLLPATKTELLKGIYARGNRRQDGVANNNNRLTRAQVRRIRGLKGKASSRAVGRRFRVSKTLVLKVWRGELWRRP